MKRTPSTIIFIGLLLWFFPISSAKATEKRPYPFYVLESASCKELLVEYSHALRRRLCPRSIRYPAESMFWSIDSMGSRFNLEQSESIAGVGKFIFVSEGQLKLFIATEPATSRRTKLSKHTLHSIQNQMPSITRIEAWGYLRGFYPQFFNKENRIHRKWSPGIGVLIDSLSDDRLQKLTRLTIEVMMTEDQLETISSRPSISSWWRNRKRRSQWRAMHRYLSEEQTFGTEHTENLGLSD